VRPGDIVLADDDGVVVVPRAHAEEAIAAAAAREEREAVVMRRLVAGELTLDVLGFRQALERRGITIAAARPEGR
jgi:4-hydroxy-4-methyl-2-oxoglutarate aldolase